MDQNAQDRIRKMVTDNQVMLFIKGTPDFPQCGFSAAVVDVLNDVGVPYAAFDVLSDPGIRQGIKDYANWPTIPQLYVKGEFIGGCDIVREMHANGELESVLKGGNG
jgi:monothiol glutaredoxin